MSGTVLSALCSICHAQPPKYKCPRCRARTCSAACVKKHKARADCDGVRNPTAFIPLSQLRTEAGIDHDFNFISSIERARQRSERDLVEIRQLLSEKDLRPPNEEKQFRKVWHGDELHHIPIQSKPYAKYGGPHEAPTFIDGFDKHVRRRLRYLDIEAITMPKGMARQRENRTAWNRRTLSINWQVEWLVYNARELGYATGQQQEPLRILCKSLEGKALSSALASALEWHRGQLDRQNRERYQQAPDEPVNDIGIDPEGVDSPYSPRKQPEPHHDHHRRPRQSTNQQPNHPAPQTQNPTSSTWPPALFTTQSHPSGDPSTGGQKGGTWNLTTAFAALPRTLEDDLATWRFFLLRVTGGRTARAGATTTTTTTTTNTNTKPLIPLSPGDTLAGALAGRTVLEFPTVYALPPGEALPAGFAVVVDEGEAGRRMAPREERVAMRGVDDDSPRERGHTRDVHVNRNGKRPYEAGYGKGRGRGRGGRAAKIGRFERASYHHHHRAREAVEEVEDGEIISDGNEVTGAGETMLDVDVDGGSENEDDDGSSGDGSSAAADEAGEVLDGKASRPRGGLVDYGSSDDSD